MSDAAGTPDAAFSMRYNGNISGPASFNMNVAGGTFSYNGTYSGLTATVQAGATLKGNATCQLFANGPHAGEGAAFHPDRRSLDGWPPAIPGFERVFRPCFRAWQLHDNTDGRGASAFQFLPRMGNSVGSVFGQRKRRSRFL